MFNFTFKEIKEKLENALINLYLNDKYILENDGHERSIAHCLANHLKKQFRILDIDCEYNININERKSIELTYNEIEIFKPNRISDDDPQSLNDDNLVSVFPDIIIHKRGENESNLLIIELKKSSSRIKDNYDYLKLRKYTDQNSYKSLKYKFGVFIKVHTRFFKGYRFELVFFNNGVEGEKFYLTDNKE